MRSRAYKPGATLGNGPPPGEAWTWMTATMLGSITHGALGVHARRILDFLRHEHASHAGKENGNLAATYMQLEAWGVTAADIPKGLQELYVTGFVLKTHQGLRQEGGGEPSRYALTWLPRPDCSLPAHEWKSVLAQLEKDGVGSVSKAKLWLKDQVADFKRAPNKKARPTPHLQVVSPITCGVGKAA